MTTDGFNEGQYNHILFSKPGDADISRLAKNDAYIINALLKCSTFPNSEELPSPDWPVIFNLLWGVTIPQHSGFPSEMQSVVLEILEEEKKRDEVYNSQEKRIHNIAIELLYFMYEMQVVSFVRDTKENSRKKGD